MTFDPFDGRGAFTPAEHLQIEEVTERQPEPGFDWILLALVAAAVLIVGFAAIGGVTVWGWVTGAVMMGAR